MIPAHTRTEILHRLRAAEDQHRVQVLLAVESGSRAWGFDSPNSDFDVRFIYVHHRDWYLSIDEQRDVIEYPIVDELDLNGWELRKALRLFRSSNPAFVEWISSPIVYLEHGPFAAACRHRLPEIYSCQRGIHHYRSMAKTNYRSHLLGEQVSLKKYFYVLRPLLSVRWLETHGTPAPIEFDKLLSLIAGQTDLIDAIQNLLARKRAAPESGLAPRIARIHAFIEAELERVAVLPLESEKPQNDATGRLNALFMQCLPE
ncbi:MAG TPA: nucleotidyltransferase domain-containing protein [Accumulibacter sp.]|nr:nucleotidyltransferase domain-containing protein [Accumulibacter sp.]HMY07876.1 nucleotidyltransferase domain-containing protein [Accumulibacter sp.]HNG38621.1 nucleotidyltransferase domain-containing protein [Accumulibacter sp.]HNH24414.1 nucleotidyltransferase domain-containing protein [Accumulibacter sp.]HNL13852.1 nucleotidyltransferase domain-containing protein [Accumulibacter sp.]